MAWNLWRRDRYKSLLAWGLVFLLGCFAIASVGRAGIVYSSPGLVSVTSPPAGGVTPGANTGSIPIVFPEILGGVMPAAGMPVDLLVTGNIATDPVVSGGVVNPALVSGVIPGGTPFDSYFFHFDPGAGGGGYPSSGSIPVEIVFSNKILGLQLFGKGDSSPRPLTGTLGDGDAISPLGTAYYPGTLSTRGVESGDSIGIYSSTTGIQLAGLAFGGQIDQVRIFVAVPEPNSALLALTGLLGLSFLAIKKVGANRRFKR